MMDEFDIVQIVGEGWFGKILLVEHKNTDTEMVLKALPKPYVSIQDFYRYKNLIGSFVYFLTISIFYREFHYGLCLGSHKNIVTTYDVAFETAGFYVFTQVFLFAFIIWISVDWTIKEIHKFTGICTIGRFDIKCFRQRHW
jgi:serine/threonine-protein kinase SBK